MFTLKGGDVNKLPLSKRTQIVGLLVEGMSLRATARLADVSLNTVSKFLTDLGAACAEFQDGALVNLPCKRVECDEIWSFCYSKQRNVPEDKKGIFGFGDIWTWTAICADTKLICSFMVGTRDSDAAKTFIGDLAPRLANRVQLTTDGHKPYLTAVESAFGGQIDYAMLVKIYASSPQGGRYSAGKFLRSERHTMIGKPNQDHVSTSYVERQNLTMRMSMRRFTRLTNAFSKKVENHAHAVALHFMYYNFGRVHKTLRVTPAMEAGIADHVWSHAEIAALAKDEAPKKRGPYKKRAAPALESA
jgi:IS1 family transposase